MSWRGAWFRAQITGLMFSSFVWLVVAGLSLPSAATGLAACVVWLVGRNTRAGLWWQFGARPATGFERDRVLAAIVPISSLRGRHQPAIWIGRRISGSDAIMPTPNDLVVSPAFVRRIATGRLGDHQVSALVCHALGRQPVHGSSLVAAVEAYCAPWGVVAIIVDALSRAASRTPVLSAAWKIRWLVFAVAIIDNATSARWNALVAVTIIATLSGTTPFFRARWTATLHTMGDERARAEGFGPSLAHMIRTTSCSVHDLERAIPPRPAPTTARRPKGAS
jgi:hypothetical protein